MFRRGWYGDNTYLPTVTLFSVLPMVFNKPSPCDGSYIIPKCGVSSEGSVSPEVVRGMF